MISYTLPGHFGKVDLQYGQLNHMVWDGGTLNMAPSQSKMNIFLYEHMSKENGVLVSGHGKRNKMWHFSEDQGMVKPLLTS